jgi:hypothetical protein
MAKLKSADNLATVQMALAGYEFEKQRIEEKIREINSLLGGKRAKPGVAKSATTGVSDGSAKPRARRVLSAAARKRIAAAQRKRWEEYRTTKAQAS